MCARSLAAVATACGLFLRIQMCLPRMLVENLSHAHVMANASFSI